MAMAVIKCRIATQKIKISFAVHIPDIYAPAFLKYNGKGMIIMGAIAVFELKIKSFAWKIVIS